MERAGRTRHGRRLRHTDSDIHLDVVDGRQRRDPIDLTSLRPNTESQEQSTLGLGATQSWWARLVPFTGWPNFFQHVIETQVAKPISIASNSPLSRDVPGREIP